MFQLECNLISMQTLSTVLHQEGGEQGPGQGIGQIGEVCLLAARWLKSHTMRWRDFLPLGRLRDNEHRV